MSLPASAAAQLAPASGPAIFGVGLSFLGDTGGTGVTLDLSKPIRTLPGGQTLGWVGDFSLHRHGFNGFGSSASLTTLTFQGGARVNGRVNEDVTWHAQGLIGVLRSSYSVGTDSLTQDFCDEFGIDCGFSGSDTRVILTPGAGINYWLNEKTALRGQLDIPIGDGGSTTRLWIGISRRLGQ